MKLDRLIELVELNGVSGCEKSVSTFLKKELSDLQFSCQTDSFGNVIAHRPGTGKHILLEAHIDQVGLMVSELSEDGFVRFSPIGGLDMRVLPAQEVVIHGKKPIQGVICFHPSDNPEDKSKVPDLKRLCIDTGLGKNIFPQISVGDFITFKGTSFIQNHCLFGHALDNRVSVETILSLIEILDTPAELTVLFAVQEEVGHFGATVASCFEQVDLAVVLDVTFGKTHDDGNGTFICGKGSAIGIGPSVSRRDAMHIRSVAEKENILHQIEVMGGSSGTDAWVIQLMSEGIPTVMLSIPLRYMHTPIEQICLSDIEATTDLLVAYIKEVCQND